MLVESVNVLENASLTTDDKIVDGDDVLTILRQANTTNVLLKRRSIPAYKIHKIDLPDGLGCQTWLLVKAPP